MGLHTSNLYLLGHESKIILDYLLGQVSKVGSGPVAERPIAPTLYLGRMKVEKEKFDALLGKLLKAKPEPRKKIKTQGKRGPKPIMSPNS